MDALRPSRIGRRPWRGAIAAALLGLGLQPVLARQDDRNQPLHTRQDSFSGFVTPNSVSTLTGHVVMTQGSTTMTGSLAKLYVDANNQLTRVVVTGQPAHFQQLGDNGRWQSGDAAMLDYDQVHGIAVLTGQAVVCQQARGETRGDVIRYDTGSGHIVADGHVSAVVLPRPAASVPPAPATSR